MSSPESTRSPDSEPNDSLRPAMLSGAFWMVATRWAVRFLGLISMVILARLLNPSDFGLVAMAMLVVGFAEAWLAFGVDMALIQDQHAGRPEFDTAWTLRFGQTTAVALIAALAAPWAAEYFGDDRLPLIMWVVAGGFFLTGFTNIGVVAFRRELRFRQEFWLIILPKLVSFTVTMVAAWVLRNYWALVIGSITLYVANVTTSYLMHPYRPRFSLATVRKLWSFSQWMLLVNVAWYLENRSDEAVIGGAGGAADMGHYSVASEVSQLPNTEISAPLARALYPVIAKMQDQPERLRLAYKKVLATITGLTFPAGVGLALVAPQLVTVALGDGWEETIPFLQVLAVFAAIRSSYGSAGSVLVAVHRVREVALVTWMHFGLFLGLALWMIDGMGLIGVAWAKLVATAVAAFVNFWLLTRATQVTFADIAVSLIRPVLATIVMSAVLWEVSGVVASAPIFGLLSMVVIGAVTYGLAATALWILMGRPDGAEHLILEKLRIVKTPA